MSYLCVLLRTRATPAPAILRGTPPTEIFCTPGSPFPAHNHICTVIYCISIYWRYCWCSTNCILYLRSNRSPLKSKTDTFETLLFTYPMRLQSNNATILPTMYYIQAKVLSMNTALYVDAHLSNDGSYKGTSSSVSQPGFFLETLHCKVDVIVSPFHILSGTFGWLEV